MWNKKVLITFIRHLELQRNQIHGFFWIIGSYLRCREKRGPRSELLSLWTAGWVLTAETCECMKMTGKANLSLPGSCSRDQTSDIYKKRWTLYDDCANRAVPCEVTNPAPPHLILFSQPHFVPVGPWGLQSNQSRQSESSNIPWFVTAAVFNGKCSLFVVVRFYNS